MPLKSEALQLIRDLTATCKKGGFQLSKWMSNSCSVLGSTAEKHCPKPSQKLNLDKDMACGESTWLTLVCRIAYVHVLDYFEKSATYRPWNFGSC